MKISKKVIVAVVVGLVLVAGFILANKASASVSTPETYNLHEGDLIRAVGDVDIYIVNQDMYKRLFLNPEIFGMYGHLGGWASVKSVSPATRDAFTTSDYYRASGDTKIYKLEKTGDDTGVLRWVNLSQAEFLATASVNSVFTINGTELAWYPKGSDIVPAVVDPIEGDLTVKALDTGDKLAYFGQDVSDVAKFQFKAVDEGFFVSEVEFDYASESYVVYTNKAGVVLTKTGSNSFEFSGSDRPYVKADGTMDLSVGFNDVASPSMSDFKLKLKSLVAVGETTGDILTKTVNVLAKDGLWTRESYFTVNGSSKSLKPSDSISLSLTAHSDDAVSVLGSVSFEVDYRKVSTAFGTVDWNAYLNGNLVDSGSISADGTLTVNVNKSVVGGSTVNLNIVFSGLTDYTFSYVQGDRFVLTLEDENDVIEYDSVGNLKDLDSTLPLEFDFRN